MPHNEGITRRAIQYAMHAYNCVADRRPRMDTYLHGADLADDILNFILDMCRTFHILKKVKQIEKKRKRENGGDNEHGSDTSNSEEGEREEENKGKTAKKKKTPASESHHINRKCLCHHLLNVHCKKGHITQKVVGKYFARGLKPKRKRGPKRADRRNLVKGRARRWCPAKGCDYLACYLPHHLQNKHRMNPKSSVYKMSLNVARKYKGLEEIEETNLKDQEAPQAGHASSLQGSSDNASPSPPEIHQSPDEPATSNPNISQPDDN